MSALKGIDVSKHQDVINWDKVKPQIDFAIIRCGYGSDMASQDDIKFKANIDACHRLGIPYGIYLYSYADTEAKLASEIKHTLRLIKDTTPFCVYFDMEDASTTELGKAKLTQFGLTFCKAMVDAGYKAGIYANQYWFRTYLDPKAFASAGYSVWCAKYATSEPDISAAYDIWQYSSSGCVDGISGNVDMNYMYNNIFAEDKPQPAPKPQPTPAPQPTKIDVIYQIWDDVKNTWLPNVKNTEDYAGSFGHDVCCVFANLSNGNITYAVHYKGGNWLPEVVNRSDYAGLYNKPIDGLMMKTDTGKTIRYRAHLRRRNAWLPWVTGYNTKDSNNGYAGILGQEIDGIQIEVG